MSKRTIYLMDNTVISDDQGNLIADNTAIDQLTRRRSFQELQRNREAILSTNEELARQQMLRRAQIIDMDDAQPKQFGAGRRRRCHGHRSRHQHKRDLRRISAQLRQYRDKLTATELITEPFDDSMPGLHCELCLQPSSYCRCHDDNPDTDPYMDYWNEYQALKQHCMHSPMIQTYARTYADYVNNSWRFVDDEVSSAYWYEDVLDDYDTDSGLGYGDRFEWRDASDFGSEVYARYGGEY